MCMRWEETAKFEKLFPRHCNEKDKHSGVDCGDFVSNRNAWVQKMFVSRGSVVGNDERSGIDCGGFVSG